MAEATALVCEDGDYPTACVACSGDGLLPCHCELIGGHERLRACHLVGIDPNRPRSTSTLE